MEYLVFYRMDGCMRTEQIITSNQNSRIKELCALQRSKKDRMNSGLFVVEGERIVSDVLKTSPELIKDIYVNESFDISRIEDVLLGTGDRVAVIPVKDSVFKGISETVTTQGILATVRMESLLRDYKTITSDATRILILEDIQDPGNLGTIVRTAEAAGMDAIIMSKGTTDIFSPKVTRATMGSILRVPFTYVENLTEVIHFLQDRQVTVYGAYLHGGVPLNEIHYAEKSAIIVGNEGNGITDATIAEVDKRVFIPMAGSIESLNAAIAAAVLMYH